MKRTLVLTLIVASALSAVAFGQFRPGGPGPFGHFGGFGGDPGRHFGFGGPFDPRCQPIIDADRNDINTLQAQIATLTNMLNANADMSNTMIIGLETQLNACNLRAPAPPAPPVTQEVCTLIVTDGNVQVATGTGFATITGNSAADKKAAQNDAKADCSTKQTATAGGVAANCNDTTLTNTFNCNPIQ